MSQEHINEMKKMSEQSGYRLVINNEFVKNIIYNICIKTFILVGELLTFCWTRYSSRIQA